QIGDVYVGRHGETAVLVGITIAPQWQRHGYAAEALRAVTREVFTDAAVDKMIAYVSTGNEASLRLFDGLGFPREGLLRSSYRDRNGQLADEIVFGLTRADSQRPAHQFEVVAFDADDTLWQSEDAFDAGERAFVELISPYAADGVDVKAALTAVERK